MIEVKRLINDVDRLRREQDTIESIHKSKFNIFQILRLEANEPRTHSAFIAELLNPRGSHLMGDIFLRAFVNTVLGADVFEVDGCTVAVEKYIGAVSEDFLKGGRLDIIIVNSKGHSLTIENKIHAKLQTNQLNRYADYNKGKNKVLYLTLKSSDVEDSSDLEIQNITYDSEILDWLEKCYVNAIDYPILRESIKQYIKLIEGLVGRLDDDNMNKELQKIILENVESSRLIALNYELAVSQIRTDFQRDVVLALENLGLTDFVIVNGKSADRANAQIWVQPANYIDKGLWFGIETFGTKGFFNGSLNMGLITVNSAVSKDRLLDKLGAENKRGPWLQVEEVKNIDGLSINFSDDLFVVKLARDIDYRNKLVAQIAQQFKSYWLKYKREVLDLVR